MSKKVLFISYDGLTDSLGQSQILPYQVGLSKLGYQITILSCEKADNFLKNHTVVLEKASAANIIWEPTHYKAAIPVVSPAMNSKRLRKKAMELAAKEGFDIIHCRSIIPASIGYKVTKKYGGKLIFDIRGFWADERVDGKIWNRKNPIYNYLYNHFKKKEKFLFENAEAIVTLTENAKTYIERGFKTKSNFLVVPCCVDFNHFDLTKITEEKTKAIKLEIGIPEDSFVLTYVGSLGARYQLTEMLQFYKELKIKQPNSCFLFISKSDTSLIKIEAKEMEIDSTSIFITSCEYTEIPNYISVGNASIFFIVTSFSGKAVSPTKQAEVMSLGLPIVANTGLGDTDVVLNSTESGIVVDNYEKNTLQNAADQLLNFNKPKSELRAAAEKYFTLEGGIEKYHHLYQLLLNN